MSKTQNRKPIEIKISTVVAVSAILHESNPLLLDAAMHDMTGGDADYFDDEFAVIDIGHFAGSDEKVDWPALLSLFRAYRLNPVAVRNATPGMEPDIRAIGLALDVLPPSRRLPAEEAIPQSEVAQPPHASATMIVDTPVRSGQRIYAQGCDLIVTAAVSNSAEVIADGSIHIYAPLRGRALAGASGNPAARIFSMQMEAELVSIAGMYRTFEDGLPKELAQQAVQVRLVGDRIELHSMNKL